MPSQNRQRALKELEMLFSMHEALGSVSSAS